MTLKELAKELGDSFVDKLNEKLLELMEEKPDFIYHSCDEPICYYNRGRGPENDGCIFGQAFQRLGVEKHNLDCNYTISDLLDAYGFIAHSEIVRSWRKIQHKQDVGYKWGELKEYLCKAS